MGELIVDNHLDFQDQYELRKALLYKVSGTLSTYVLGKVYIDTTTNKVYAQSGAANIELSKQGTVTTVSTTQPSIIDITSPSSTPTITIAYASGVVGGGLMTQAYASMLDNATDSFVAGRLAKWNSSAGPNINGTAANVTASLDQIPAPAANVNMNNKQFVSLAVATANGQAVEYSQLTSHTGDSTIHTPLDDAAHTNNKVISAFEVDARISAALVGISGNTLPPVQDLTALKAIDTTASATYPDKTLIHVEDAGLYRLDRDSSATEDSPRIIAPTTGVGRWYRISTPLADHNNLSAIQGGTTGEAYHTTLAQNQALAGTAGTPSSTNLFVTDQDTRMTNARTPTGSAGGDLGGTYPNPTVTGISFTVGVGEGGTGATTAAGARKALGLPEVKEQLITGGASLTYNHTHNLNNLAVSAAIWEDVGAGVWKQLFFVITSALDANTVQYEFGADCTGRSFKSIITGVDLNP